MMKANETNRHRRTIYQPTTTQRGDILCVPKHRQSKILKRGILGFVADYGHEDIMLRPQPKG